MTQEQKKHIQQLAKEHFRYSFSHIKAKADSKGAHLEAYYLFLVDDFFAVGDAAISREAIKAYDQYDALRKDFEDCLLNALAECDKEGLFGNREENGLLLFAFYIDDYDGNEEDSLLYRSTELLNPKKDWDKLKG